MSKPAGIPRKEFLLCLAVALTLRLVALWLSGPELVRFGDGEDYLIHASRLCADGEYPERGNNHFFRPPGLPFFIAAVTLCQPQRIVAVKVSLVGIDTLSVGLIGLLAFLIWNDRLATRSAIWLAAVFPPFGLQVTDIRSEPLLMFALTGSLVLFLTGRRESQLKWLVASGLAAGLAALVRPSALMVIPFLAAAALVRSAERRRRSLAGAVLLLAGSLVVIVPWTARNLLRFGEFLVINDAQGINAYRGASPEMFEVMTAPDAGAAERALRRFEKEYGAAADWVAVQGDSPGERDRLWRGRALDLIAADVPSYLRFLGWKAVSYWRPWLNPRFHGPRKVVLSAALLVPVLIAAVVGLSLLRRRDRWLFRFLLTFLILGCLAHVPFQTVMRFRIPFADPLYLALAAGSLLELGRLRPARLEPPSAPRPTSGRRPVQRDRRSQPVSRRNRLRVRGLRPHSLTSRPRLLQHS